MLHLIDQRLRNILTLQEFCGLCLEKTHCAWSTNVYFEIIIHGKVYRKRFKDIIGDIFCDLTYLPASTNICKGCTDKTLEFYIFVKSIKETAKNLDCYVNCLYHKIVSIDEKLDPFQCNGGKKCSIVLCSRYRSKHEVNIQKNIKVNTFHKENIATVSVDATDGSVSTILEDEGKKPKHFTEDTGEDRKKTDCNELERLAEKNKNYYEKHASDFDNNVLKHEIKSSAVNNKNHFEKDNSESDNNISQYEIESSVKKKINKTKKKKVTRLNKVRKNVTVKRKPIKKESEIRSEQHVKNRESMYDSNENLCEICLKYFSSDQFKDHHCRSKCLVCLKKPCMHEKYLNSYRDQIINETDNIKCPDCEFICKKKYDLIDHANREHLDHRPYSCSDCSEKFFNTSDYANHKTSHSIEKRYTCKLCNIDFSEQAKLASHNRKHKRSQQNKIKCNVCSKEIFETTLNMHMKLHDGTESHNYTCETCGKSFAFKVRLYQHIMTHSDPKPCNLCGQLIKPTSMYLHLKRHKIKLNPALKPKPAKKRHNKKCDYCEYTTYCKDVLEIHMNKEHLKVKPHVCHVCGVSYLSKYYLNHHMKVHTEEKKFNCTICNKSLRHKIGLKKHMMLHTGEQPHICEVCGEGYKTVTMLKYHMQKHKGKNDQCPLCGGMYYSIKHVRTHIKKCHWEFKDRKFDYKQVRGLTKEHYHIFQDRRKALADDIYDDD